MTVTLQLRVLSGVLLSFIWIGANLAVGSNATADNASTFSEAFRAVPGTIPTDLPPDTLPPPVTTFPSASPAGVVTILATAEPTPNLETPKLPRKQILSQMVESPDFLQKEYRYYERSQDVTALQIELGVHSVDGIYGPVTRRAHIEALGGPHNAVIIFYPELFETPTPCSHGCLPGDSHYELPTLGELIRQYFKPEHHELAHKIAFCESSAQSWHIGSEVVSHAFAIGWFQHLAKYWPERSEKAGWGEYHPFHAEANVAVAAWLFYGSGIHHWNPSRACWGATNQPPPTTSSLPPA
jgi:hypothetical protein